MLDEIGRGCLKEVREGAGAARFILLVHEQDVDAGVQPVTDHVGGLFAVGEGVLVEHHDHVSAGVVVSLRRICPRLRALLDGNDTRLLPDQAVMPRSTSGRERSIAATRLGWAWLAA